MFDVEITNMKIYYWHNPYDLDYLITDLNRIHKKGYSIWRADNLGCILKKSRSQTTYSITKALDRKNRDKKHVSNVGIWEADDKALDRIDRRM